MKKYFCEYCNYKTEDEQNADINYCKMAFTEKRELKNAHGLQQSIVDRYRFYIQDLKQSGCTEGNGQPPLEWGQPM